MAILRYDQQTPLVGNLLGTDMLCFSRVPYGAGAPFVHAELTDIFNYVNTLLSPLFFAGTWNAFTNTPPLLSGSGVNGAVYVVNTAGTTDLDGHNDWKVGDWAVFDENIMEWTQVANEVISTVNIYNSDGLLTGNRTLNLNGKVLKLGTGGIFGTVIYIDPVTPEIGIKCDGGDINLGNITQNTINAFAQNINLAAVSGGTLAFTGNNITAEAADFFTQANGANAFTVGSSTYQGLGNGGTQVDKGKFNVILNDEGGIYSNSFVRFSDSLPNTLIIAKSRGTEAVPAIVQDGDLLGVFAFAAHDGTTFSGLPNFNLASGMFCLAAPGQAAANTPGSLLFNVNLAGESIGTTFLSFNLSGLGDSVLGQGSSGTGANSVVIGNFLNNMVAEEVLIGTTTIGGSLRLLAPIINFDSSNISLVAAPFIGTPVQYLTVNSAGLIVPVAAGSDLNIYNSDGILTATRALNLGGNDLYLGSNLTSLLNLNSSGFLQLTSSNGMSVNTAGSLTVAATTTLVISAPTIYFSNRATVFPVGSFSTSNDIAGPINTILIGATTNTSQFYCANSNLATDINATFENIANSDAALISLARARGSDQSSKALVQPNDLLGDIEFYGYDGAKYLGAASIRVRTTTAALNSLTASLAINAASFSLQSNTAQLQGAYQFTSSPFTGIGTRFLTVDPSGNLGVSTGSGSVNIYNSDGSLTGNRTLTMGTNFLNFTGSPGSSINVISSLMSLKGIFSITTDTTSPPININIGGVDIGVQSYNQCANYLGIDAVIEQINNTDSTSLSFARARNITSSSKGIVQFTDVLGWVDFLGFDGSTYQRAAVWQAVTITAMGGNVTAGTWMQTDNFMLTQLGLSSNVNYGVRSGIFFGQTNKINAPNVLPSSDNFIFGGDTTTMTGAVYNSTMSHCLNSSIGDDTNIITNATLINCTGDTVTLYNYVVDINGSGNTFLAQNCVFLNVKAANINNVPLSVDDGRYFMANVNGVTLTGGFYLSAISVENPTYSYGDYCVDLAAVGSKFNSPASHSAILSGNTNTMSGTYCAILSGSSNTVGNVSNSMAIGTLIALSHNNVIAINDGGLNLTSQKDSTVLIQASNGVGIGIGQDNPNRDVTLGKKLGLYSVSRNTSFSTDSLPAILYLLTTSTTLTMTLADADKVSNNIFLVQQVGGGGIVTLQPQSGTINGAASIVLMGGAIITSDGTNWITVKAIT